MNRSPTLRPWAGHAWLRAGLLSSVALLSACLPASEQSTTDGEDLFEPSHLIEVVIELPDEDWKALRGEGRSLPATLSGCGDEDDFAYTEFDATVTVDGEAYPHVVVRKKGFLGSISVGRPSFKLNFGKGEKYQARRHDGMKRMTLNNDRQDPSHTHQCMAYDLFRQAGLAAPRCNHAHVVVNGEDLGTYSHVESIKKPFIRQHFADDDGLLFEGNSLGDFTDTRVRLYESKDDDDEDDESPDSGKGNRAYAPLMKVVEALGAPDSELYEALDEVLDMDAFLTFWAMEVLVGQWDGYAGNRNNHYAYQDGPDGRLYFIPWGADSAFTGVNPFLPPLPRSVQAYGALVHRLYGHAKIRKLYRDRLQQLRDDLWRPEKLRAEIDRIAKLTSTEAPHLEATREFIRTQGKLLDAELKEKAPTWPLEYQDALQACTPLEPIAGTFETEWGDDPEAVLPTPGTTLSLTVEGERLLFAFTGASAAADNGLNTLNFYAVSAAGRAFFLRLEFPRGATVGEVPFHGFETFGVLLENVGDDPMVPELEARGFVGDGVLVFEQLGTDAGDAVSGSFHAKLVSL